MEGRQTPCSHPTPYQASKPREPFLLGSRHKLTSSACLQHPPSRVGGSSATKLSWSCGGAPKFGRYSDSDPMSLQILGFQASGRSLLQTRDKFQMPGGIQRRPKKLKRRAGLGLGACITSVSGPHVPTRARASQLLKPGRLKP